MQSLSAGSWRGFPVSLQDNNVDAVQPQFAGEHDARRTAAGNNDIDHDVPRILFR